MQTKIPSARQSQNLTSCRSTHNTMKSRQLLKQPRLLITAVFNNKITGNLYQFEFPVAVIFKIWTI